MVCAAQVDAGVLERQFEQQLLEKVSTAAAAVCMVVYRFTAPSRVCWRCGTLEVMSLSHTLLTARCTTQSQLISKLREKLATQQQQLDTAQRGNGAHERPNGELTALLQRLQNRLKTALEAEQALHTELRRRWAWLVRVCVLVC